MKKTLLILALTVVSFANAQKGTYLVSGTVAFNSEKVNTFEEQVNQNDFSIAPKIGYQFSDNWTVGIQSSASLSKNEIIDSGAVKSNYYGVGTFVRYSKPLSEIFEIYADFGSSYYFGNTNYTNFENITYHTSKSNGFSVSIAPALLLKIKNGFGLNFGLGGLGYNSFKITSENNASYFQKTKAFYFNFGQAFTAGISKNF